MTSFDAIVIGGGHNGLTAASFIARAGRKVLLVEAQDELGGAARGDEFHPGFVSPGLAHVVNRLDREVATELGLAEAANGEHAPTAVLSLAGKPVILRGGYGETIEGVDASEAEAFQRLRQKLFFQAAILKRFLKSPPPAIGSLALSDIGTLAGAGLKLIGRGREEARDFLRMLLMNVADIADEYLSDDRLKALLAFDATLGIHLGPRSPTSLLGLYYRLTGEASGVAGGQFVARGNGHSLAAAFEKAARRQGVTILTGTAVKRIVADRGTVTGIVLTDGEEILAPVVVSAIHPKATFLDLTDAAELGTGFRRAVTHIRSKGNVAKLDLALAQVPSFKGLPADALKGRLVIARSIDHVEEAFNPAKYGAYSADPVMEITLPSLTDPDLAPAGQCMLSALVQFAPYALAEGWEKGKPAFQKIVLETLEAYSPGIGASILAARLLTPVDIEARYHLPGGHWHHGELQADQLLLNRPVNAASGHRSPLKGLFLASAGSHPGGGISGLPGLLAARQVLSGESA